MEKDLVLTKAKNAEMSHDFVTAVRLYKELLKDQPENIQYLLSVGSIYVKSGEDEKAIPFYEQIISYYPHYVDAMNSLGAIFRRLKRYDESIAILKKALEEDRQPESVNYNLGFTYKEMGLYDQAIDCFELVVSINHDDVLAYNHLGSIYSKLKEFDKAIQSYKRGLQIDQNHPILNYNLARCYEETEQSAEAIRCYERTLKTKPGWTDAIHDFSDLLVKCQKTKDAQQLVQRSIALYPDDEKLLCTLGNIFLTQFDYDSAEKTFKRAKVVNGSNIDILSGLAQALERGDKIDEALSTIEEALKIAPENLRLQKQEIASLLSNKEYEDAFQKIESMEKLYGDSDPEVLDLFGQYYICVNDEQSAQYYFDKIKKVDRSFNHHLLSAADRYSQMGKTEKAEEYAMDYVARKGTDPAGYNTLGRVYARAGKLEEALDNFNRVLELVPSNSFALKQAAKIQKKIEEKESDVESAVKNGNSFDMSENMSSENALGVSMGNHSDFTGDDDKKDFDFSSMGDKFSSEEALPISDEEAFWDGDLSDEFEDTEEEKARKEQEQKEKEAEENAPYYRPDATRFTEPAEKENTEGLEMVDDGNNDENDAQEPVEDLVPEETDGQPEDESFDFSQFDDTENKAMPKNEENIFGDETDDNETEGLDEIPEPAETPETSLENDGGQTPFADKPQMPEPQFQTMPKDFQPAPIPQQMPSQMQPQLQPQMQPQMQLSPELDRRIQETAMNSANYAMQAAMAAQQMAKQVADEQEKLAYAQQQLEEKQKETERMQEELVLQQAKTEQLQQELLEERNKAMQAEVTAPESTDDEVAPEEEIISEDEIISEEEFETKEESVMEEESTSEETWNASEFEEAGDEFMSVDDFISDAEPEKDFEEQQRFASVEDIVSELVSSVVEAQNEVKTEQLDGGQTSTEEATPFGQLPATSPLSTEQMLYLVDDNIQPETEGFEQDGKEAYYDKDELLENTESADTEFLSVDNLFDDESQETDSDEEFATVDDFAEDKPNISDLDEAFSTVDDFAAELSDGGQTPLVEEDLTGGQTSTITESESDEPFATVEDFGQVESESEESEPEVSFFTVEDFVENQNDGGQTPLVEEDLTGGQTPTEENSPFGQLPATSPLSTEQMLYLVDDNIQPETEGFEQDGKEAYYDKDELLENTESADTEFLSVDNLFDEESQETDSDEEFATVEDFAEDKPNISDSDEAFSTVDDFAAELSDGGQTPLEEEDLAGGQTSTITDPESDDPFATVEDFGQVESESADSEPENQKNNDIQSLLQKIEDMLQDNSIASEYRAELEMFKKLKLLMEFLPADAVSAMNLEKLRVQIEYIISRISGKPGLCMTITSLIKSGALGDDYAAKLAQESAAAAEMSENAVDFSMEIIMSVIQTMKKLAGSLPDEELSKALCDSADEVLRKITE